MEIADIRKDFPILKRNVGKFPLVYLDNAATSQKPIQVLSAMDEYYKKHNANVHRGVHTLSVEATEAQESSRAVVAGYIGAQPEEVIWVRNATEGLNLAAIGIKKLVGKSAAVVVTEMEHHANLLPWQRLCAETGAELRVVAVDGEGRLVLRGVDMKKFANYVYGSFEELVDEKVKIMAVSMVSNVTGVINPVEEMVDRVRKANSEAIVVLDACQWMPHKRLDVRKLDADFVAFSGHKMLGPMGIGVLWGKRERLLEMEPWMLGGDMVDKVSLSGATWNSLPWKFEAGTPNVAGAVGLASAIKYLEGVDMEAAFEHEKLLTKIILTGLLEYEQQGFVRVFGPRSMENRVGVVSFVVPGVHAHDVAQVLDNEGIAVRSGQHCAAPLVSRLGENSLVRASVYLYNTEAEVRKLLVVLPRVRKIFLV